jgi:hypothetical protein
MTKKTLEIMVGADMFCNIRVAVVTRQSHINTGIREADKGSICSFTSEAVFGLLLNHIRFTSVSSIPLFTRNNSTLVHALSDIRN